MIESVCFQTESPKVDDIIAILFVQAPIKLFDMLTHNYQKIIYSSFTGVVAQSAELAVPRVALREAFQLNDKHLHDPYRQFS